MKTITSKLGITLFSTLLISCAESSFDNQPVSLAPENASGIIGGTLPSQSSQVARATVALGIYQGSSFKQFCTGVLISQDIVLTARHCLESVEVREQADPKVYLYFGSSTSNYDKKLERVSTTFLKNPDYKPIVYEPLDMVASASGDVGLLKLDTPAPTNSLPASIAIDVSLKAGQQVVLAGWGVTDDKLSTPTTQLRQTKVAYLDSWETHFVFDQSQNQGACRGDSGGPAYLEIKSQAYVIGTTRGAHAFTDCDGMIEYTNLGKNIHFIQSGIEQLKGQKPKIISLNSDKQ